MKISSFDAIFHSTKSTFTRFPLQVIAVLLAMAACFFTIHMDSQPAATDKYLKLALICNVAFVALMAADLYAAVNDWKPVKQWVLRILVVAFSVVLYYSLEPELYIADRFKVFFVIIAMHLLVSYSAFLHQGTLGSFWEFNKILLLRILTAGFYAAVLFAGLSVALVAIDQLFNANVNSKVYLDLLTLTGIGFTAFFFMAGVPSDFKTLHTSEPVYPKGLKVFTQYVLIPLMLVYLAILLFYEITILVSWRLPKGTVSMLILSYAVVGLLCVLLVFPIKERAENRWLMRFSKFIFVMMIPLLVLLVLAIWARIRHYGITEPRYILIVLAIWLSIITVYFLVSTRHNIRIIPISLSVLALLATFGPQSASNVSSYSQLKRLNKYNQARNKEGMLEKRHIVQYLVSHHGLKSLQPFAKVNLQGIESSIRRDSVSSYSRYMMTTKMVDTAYYIFKVNKPELELKGTRRQLIFVVDKKSPLAVKGYDYMIPLGDTTPIQLAIDSQVVSVSQAKRNTLSVKIGQQVPLLVDVRGLVKDTESAFLQGEFRSRINEDYYQVPGNSMVKTIETAQYKLQLVMTELFLGVNTNSKDDYTYRGYLLIKIK